MKQFYAPSYWEAPRKIRSNCEYFGMGATNAQKLAQKLNLLNPNHFILIFGTAASLHPAIKPGECFLISKVFSKNGEYSTELPKELSFMPHASTYSSEKIVSRSEDKKALASSTPAQLLDCESFFLWDFLTERVQSRVILIRGVIDGIEDNIDYIQDDFKVDWLSLSKPSRAFQFITTMKNFNLYQRGLKRFLNQIMRVALVEKNLEIDTSF